MKSLPAPINNFEITNIWFLLLLTCIAIVIIVAASINLKNRNRIAFITVPFAIVLLVVAILGGVNAHYRYIPTVGDLFINNKKVTPENVLEKALNGNDSGEAAHAVIKEIDIPGTISGFQARPATIWLPPEWMNKPNQTYPVLMLLHGSPGGPPDWVRGGGAAKTADEWQRKHDGKAPILLMPDINGTFYNDTECINGKMGNVESYLTQDVKNFAVEHLRAKPDGLAWAVGGLSEGGYCSAMLTLKHPTTFKTFLAFGADNVPAKQSDATKFFEGSAEQAKNKLNDYDLLNLMNNYNGPSDIEGYFISGSKDAREVASAKKLVDLAELKKLNIKADVIKNGGHTFETWEKCLVLTFPDVAQRLIYS